MNQNNNNNHNNANISGGFWRRLLLISASIVLLCLLVVGRTCDAFTAPTITISISTHYYLLQGKNHHRYNNYHRPSVSVQSPIGKGRNVNAMYNARKQIYIPTTQLSARSRFLLLLEDSKPWMNTNTNTKGAGRPYLEALIDQLLEQTPHERAVVAFLTTRKDMEELSKHNTNGSNININDNDDDDDLEAVGLAWMNNIQSSLGLQALPELVLLDDWNPERLEERFSSFDSDNSDNKNDPTMYWLYGTDNAYWTRHLLRTSGFDRWIQRQCGGSKKASCIFVGEGTGARCAGATMDMAKQKGDDPKASPEFQAFGLDLVADSDSEMIYIRDLDADSIYVWAQPAGDEHATRFLFWPGQKGTITAYNCNLDPLEALLEEEEQEGVACYGEPSIDPSRAAQADRIGDSEWWE